MGPAQPPVQGPLWGSFLVGVQRMRLEGDHCLPFSAKSWNEQGYTSAAQHAVMAYGFIMQHTGRRLHCFEPHCVVVCLDIQKMY